MNVALLADTAWLDEELSWFQHLVVGLVDERVRVIQVMPEDLPGEASSLFSERVRWSESKWKEVNRWRLAKLDETLEKADAHVLHALDARLWRGALALSDELSVPALLTANSADAVREVERLARDVDPGKVAFSATTEPIGAALRARLDPAVHLEVVPPGVHAGAEAPGCEDDHALCVIVSGDGTLDAAYQSLLRGLVDVVREHPGMQFFFDGQGSDQHAIWKAASKLGLLQNISLIPRRLGHRELLLRADALVHPQPLGLSRSLTLQAMAHALSIVAHEDPWLDYLIDDETARLVREPEPDAWVATLQSLLNDRAAADALGRSARAWVRQHRPVSAPVNQTLNLYRRLTGATMEFPDASA